MFGHMQVSSAFDVPIEWKGYLQTVVHDFMRYAILSEHF